jgi:hypothetical protein
VATGSGGFKRRKPVGSLGSLLLAVRPRIQVLDAPLQAARFVASVYAGGPTDQESGDFSLLGNGG